MEYLAGIGGTGVIIGILEGISLGLYYKKIKSIGVLAVCGAFGFGLGGIIEIMSFGIVLGTINSNLVPVIRVILFVITGLIGGAALGYGTYYLKHPTKNVGFSRSARATEPQVPEGMVRYALR